jgi:prepilin-type N-terminal cleavage/methylation domain-containing protein/prepilin-type processing-associated H-X9-DG protein
LEEDMDNNHGFTLIEVLVVLGIILLLVAILVPVILKAKDFAFSYYCMNNLHVLGKSYHAYAEDYNNGIVPMIRASAKYGGREWYTTLKPYGKDILGREAYGSGTDSWVRCPKYRPTYNAYAQNDRIGFKDFLGQRSYFPVKFSQIPNPSTMVLMCEHGALLHNYNLKSNLGKDWGQPHYNYFPTPHFGTLKSNGRWIEGNGSVLFCDGHAESINWKNNWLQAKNLYVNP